MVPASRIPAVEGTHGTLAGTLRRPGRGLQLGSGGGLLRAEHHLQVADATAAQFLPHDTGQRAAAGLRDIRYPQQGGVSLLPVPSADRMGILRSMACWIRSSLQVTRSMQSAM